jgi:2-methylcitrate dehydratase PrpD
MVSETKITEEISKFVVGTELEDFPREVQQIAKRCITDGIGVILAGSTEPCSRIVRKYVLSAGGKKESSILGKGGVQVPVRFAPLSPLCQKGETPLLSLAKGGREGFCNVVSNS